MKPVHSLQSLLSRLQKNWPEAQCAETTLYLSLNRLNAHLDASANRIIEEHNLTPGGFDVLNILRSQPSPGRMTPSELKEIAIVSSGGMTKILKQLEEKDLIKRTAHESDKRSSYLELTRSGKSLVERITPQVMQGDRTTLSKALTKQEIKQLSDTLLDIVNKLEETEH